MDSLPEHLLATIAKHLPSRIDTLCFRAVCNSFRSSVPSPPRPLSPLSHLKISFPPGLTDAVHGHLELAESTIYAIQPLNETTKPWLVKIEESSSGKIQVLDPLFRLRVKNSSEMLPNSLNLLDYRVKEITKSYRLQTVSNSDNWAPFNVEKVVISTDDIDGFVLMALISEGRVGVWQSENQSWAIIETGYGGFYSKDIAYHNKKFYAMGYDGFTITVDPKYLNITQAAAAPTATQSHIMVHCLVKSCEDLFLINKFWLYKYYQHGPPVGESPIRFDVFRLDEEEGEWIQVKDVLKERVLFLGEDCSFFLPAKEFPEHKGNCGYLMYMDLSGVDYDYDYYPPTEEVAYFDLDDDMVDIRPSPESRSGALQRYSKIFWPPPTWLKQNSNSALTKS